jgi:hypothetical protein
MEKRDHLEAALAYLERAELYLLRAKAQENEKAAALYRQMSNQLQKLAVTEENLAGLEMHEDTALN